MMLFSTRNRFRTVFHFHAHQFVGGKLLFPLAQHKPDGVSHNKGGQQRDQHRQHQDTGGEHGHILRHGENIRGEPQRQEEYINAAVRVSVTK